MRGLGAEGLTDELIEKIMAEHGKTVTKANAQRDARADIKPDDLEALKARLEAAAEAAKAYEGVDIDALKAGLAEAQSASEALKAKHAEQVSAIAADLLLREKLATVEFSSDYARSGVLSDIKGKVKYEPGEDGAIGVLTGVDEALSEIRESKPTAFAAEQAQKKSDGASHRNGGGGDKDAFLKGFYS